MQTLQVLLLTLLPLQVSATESAVDYEKQIKPLLAERCYTCHGVLKQESDLRLDTGAAMLTGGGSGPSVVAGKSGESLLIERVADQDPETRMPPEGEGAALKPEEIALLKAWIDQGAKIPADEKPEPDPREHWAFKSPVRPEVPQVQHPKWVLNPVDAFIAAEHDRHELVPQKPADKLTLLRRVTFDLTGLPPTRTEIKAFMADKSPDAYEKVVDRLLATPQYGEHWGRHWMDVWRYSDPWGLGEEVRNAQKHMWHWRDWIVESLNNDLGYDEMIRQMLAADELYPTDESKVRATGYLVRSYFIFNRTSWLDETIEHSSKGFLGLTMNCAKCHDHKFDPFAQRDYYRLRAFFEPYQVRTDQVRGEVDFERDGIPRAFDANLDEPTYRYIRGMEGSPVKDDPLTPGLPALLEWDELKIEPVQLPLEAYRPELKPWVLDNYLAGAERDIAVAVAEVAKSQKVLAQVEKRDSAGMIAAAPAKATPARIDDGTTTPKEPEVNEKDASPKKAAVKKKTDSKKSEKKPSATKAATSPAKADLPAKNDKQEKKHGEATASADPLPSLEEAKAAAEAAQKTLIAAVSLPVAIRARHAAYLAERSSADNAKQLALEAARAEQLANYQAAARDLAKAELKLATARFAPIDVEGPRYSDLDDAAKEKHRQQERDRKVKGAQNDVKKAKDAHDKLVAGLEKPAEKYTPLLGARKAAESSIEKEKGIKHVYPPTSTGRRTAPARWITDRRNPLTARVAVNHIWMRHFGAPLVSTVFDFGRKGTPPTHPELLDYLAVELMEHDWSMKSLHRLLVTSNAYRMSSSNLGGDANEIHDVDNRYLWRQNSNRMEAQVVRDALLAMSGKLDMKLGGPTTKDPYSPRRGIYLTHSHNDRDRFMGIFNNADVAECYRREQGIIPQQALALFNSRQAMEASVGIAEELSKDTGLKADDEFIRAAFQVVLSDDPNKQELAACREALAAWEKAEDQHPLDAPSRARVNLIHSLLNHNDFITIR